MKISFNKSLSKHPQLLLIPFYADLKNLSAENKSWLQKRIEHKDINGHYGEHLIKFSDADGQPKKTVFWCFGTEKSINAKKVRSNFALALKELRKHPLSTLEIALSSQFAKYPQEIGEALALANYNHSFLKTGQDLVDLQAKQLKEIIIVSADINRTQKFDLEEGFKIGLTVNMVRDLINSPHNIVNSDEMAKTAEEICKKNRFKVTIFDRKQLEKMKMGALLGVNDGSKLGAKMVIMEHLPLGKRQDPIVLVGKGVTFDTGGVNIKPSNGIAEMHMDMAGAAVVMGVFSLLKELEIKQNVIGVIPLTDNSVDAQAQKPADIITSYSGKTIEIGNTDAEGRLILCDAISYAVKTYKPSQVIDIATLTGACIVALGDQMAGLFGNNSKMKDRLKNAAQETDEEVWELPIHEVHRKGMKGKFADLNNVDGSGMAGASTGAAFIEYFVEDTDWVHLDIAGPAMPKKPKEIDFVGGTGYGVRLLTRYLQNIK